MCLAAGTGAKQSSELRLIENCSWICWANLPADWVADLNLLWEFL